jgi:hypothetical protein
VKVCGGAEATLPTSDTAEVLLLEDERKHHFPLRTRLEILSVDSAPLLCAALEGFELTTVCA